MTLTLTHPFEWGEMLKMSFERKNLQEMANGKWLKIYDSEKDWSATTI